MADCEYAIACGACDTCMGEPDVPRLWKDLADALNALEREDVALVFDYSDLNGPRFSGLDRSRVQWDEDSHQWIHVHPVALGEEQG